ncbi:MAG: Zn-ribbon domain-containing OB-fold protein [Caulobacterales bacterium]|jgi:uncharacterized OB-fold protein
MGRQIPVAEKLFTQGPEGPRLLAGRDRETGKMVFPLPAGAEAARYDSVALSPHGRLWSYTVQRFPPKPPFQGEQDPAKFKPYAVGYVEIPGEIIVETRIDTETFNGLRVGQPMELTLIPFRTTPEGDSVMTFAFKPTA